MDPSMILKMTQYHIFLTSAICMSFYPSYILGVKFFLYQKMMKNNGEKYKNALQLTVRREEIFCASLVRGSTIATTL